MTIRTTKIGKDKIEGLTSYLTLRHCREGIVVRIKMRDGTNFALCEVKKVDKDSKVKIHGSSYMLCELKVLEWL